MNIPVLIDCDPGADDVFALLRILILHHRHSVPLDLVAITTVGGNVSSDHTYANAVRMVDFVWVEGIAIGKDKRPVSAEGDASHIHGADGIGNLSSMLPPPSTQLHDYDSVDLMIEMLDRHSWQLTILATGPMTNLARVEAKRPGILRQAKYIIAMGWSFVWGNVTPVAEFNIRYDPESAKAVFAATDNIVLIPLDVTQSMVYTMADTERFLPRRQAGLTEINHSVKAEFMRQLTAFAISTNTRFRETHYEQWFFVHDAQTVGFLLYPHLYRGTLMDVQVETKGEYTRGQTIVDTRNYPRIGYHKSLVLTSVDKYGLLEALTQDFKEFDFG